MGRMRRRRKEGGDGNYAEEEGEKEEGWEKCGETGNGRGRRRMEDDGD